MDVGQILALKKMFTAEEEAGSGDPQAAMNAQQMHFGQRKEKEQPMAQPHCEIRSSVNNRSAHTNPSKPENEIWTASEITNIKPSVDDLRLTPEYEVQLEGALQTDVRTRGRVRWTVRP